MTNYISQTWKTQQADLRNHIVVCTPIEQITHLKCDLCTISITRKKVFKLRITDIKSIDNQHFFKYLNGVEIHILPFDGRHELVIILIETAFEHVFIQFIKDIIETLQTISTEQEAVNVLHIKVNEWHKLFE